MKKSAVYIVLLVVLFNSCTRQTVIDTGTSSPFFAGNMMDYLRSDEYNWKLTVQLIEHAGLTALFEGKDAAHPAITFFGFKSTSVERFLFDSQFRDTSRGVFTRVEDIPVALAREMVLKHVVEGKYVKVDINFINEDRAVSDSLQAGGTRLITMGGSRLIAYRQNSDYAGIPDAGPVLLHLYSLTRNRQIPLATPDIQPLNGVVHALNYGYEFPEI